MAIFFLKKIYLPRVSFFFTSSDSALPNGSPFHFAAQGQNGSGNGDLAAQGQNGSGNSDLFIPQLEVDWYFFVYDMLAMVYKFIFIL